MSKELNLTSIYGRKACLCIRNELDISIVTWSRPPRFKRHHPIESDSDALFH